MAVRKGEWSRATRGGIVAGLVGGVAIAVLGLIIAAAGGQDPWIAMKGAAVPFLGKEILVPGFAAGPVLLGIIMHFVVSAVWGMLFGWLFYGIGRTATIVAGLMWGLVVWI